MSWTQRRRSRQVGIDRLARRRNRRASLDRQLGDGAAVTARRFGRRRRVEHRLALLGVGHAMAGQRRGEQAIVVATIHVDEAAPIEHRDLARRFLVASEQRLQSAFSVAGEDLGEKRATDERRMAALAAKGRIDDRRAARSRGAQDARDVEARMSGASTGDSRKASTSAGSEATPACTLENMPLAKSGLRASTTSSAASSGASASALKPATTWMRRTPASRKLATTWPISVRPPKGSSGLNAPMREEKPAASTTATTCGGVGLGAARRHLALAPGGRRRRGEVDLVLGEDLLDLLPGLEDEAGQRCCFSAGSKLIMSLQSIAAELVGHDPREPARVSLDHHVEVGVRALVVFGAAAVEAEDAAAACETSRS